MKVLLVFFLAAKVGTIMFHINISTYFKLGSDFRRCAIFVIYTDVFRFVYGVDFTLCFLFYF